MTLYNTTAQPKSGMDGNYIGIVGGADYIMNFLNGGVQFFSFVLNNLGTNDKLTLTFADGTTNGDRRPGHPERRRDHRR